jgi:hypothetical protein
VIQRCDQTLACVPPRVMAIADCGVAEVEAS